MLPSEPLMEGEAVCFYSPTRRATKECSHCGVLISDPWAAQWGARTVCLKCLDHLREKGTDQGFQSSRVLWDNVALVLALLPCTFILWVVAFVTAPAAVFIALWHWNSPRSMVAPGRWRLVAALILAHSHPSGDPTPSPDDRALTQRLVAAGTLLGVDVLDHIVVGHGQYASFKMLGLL